MRRLIPLLVLISLGCQPGGLSPVSSQPTAASQPSPGLVSPPAESPTSLAPAVSAAPTLTPVPPTPDPYEPYTIDFLRKRAYGGGNIEVLEKMEETDSFTRYRIRYPSDGLKIYGFVNVPKGAGPFPVIVGVHGFVDAATYQTLDYTTPALDSITQAGYIVFHPDLRGYPPSDNGDNLFRVGMAIDVLNLISLIKSGSGPAEVFGAAAPDEIGLWGHSMGGDVVLRVLTVSPDVKAAVLYASMSGDETRNAQLLSAVSPDPAFQTELAAAPEVVRRISPLYYYNLITAPVQLHHGTADLAVPVAWAEETCAALTAADVRVECIYYPEEDHTFRSRIIAQFGDAVLAFYRTSLSP